MNAIVAVLLGVLALFFALSAGVCGEQANVRRRFGVPGGYGVVAALIVVAVALMLAALWVVRA